MIVRNKSTNRAFVAITVRVQPRLRTKINQLKEEERKKKIKIFFYTIQTYHTYIHVNIPLQFKSIGDELHTRVGNLIIIIMCNSNTNNNNKNNNSVDNNNYIVVVIIIIIIIITFRRKHWIYRDNYNMECRVGSCARTGRANKSLPDRYEPCFIPRKGGGGG